MPFPLVTKKDVLKALNDTGIVSGDNIYVASFTPILGNSPNIFNDTIDALCETVGVDGTIIMPTFNWDYCQGLIYDPKETPSQVGILTELFRKRHEVIRTLSPPWCTFAVKGKMAARIGSIKGSSSFGSDSVLQLLYNENVKYVLLGCSYNDGVIHTHWLEEKYEVPYRYWKKFKGRIKIDNKFLDDTSLMYARDLEIDPEVEIAPLTKLFEKSGKVNVARLGLGDIRVFYVKDYIEFIIPYIEKDRLIFLTPDAKKRYMDKCNRQS